MLMDCVWVVLWCLAVGLCLTEPAEVEPPVKPDRMAYP